MPPGSQAQGQCSPDSQWIAYLSDESGRFEVYVRPVGEDEASIRAWTRASGWLATAQRLLDDGPYECAERGLLLVLESRALSKDRNQQAAYEASCRAVEIGSRFDDS